MIMVIILCIGQSETEKMTVYYFTGGMSYQKRGLQNSVRIVKM